jgi:hypothetical protein
MEMAGKQFSPFMEMVVQPFLTAYVTASYSLCNCVLRLVQLRLTVYGNGWQQFSPFMEMVVQPCLTAYVTASYSLCNCVLQLVQLRLTVYGNGWQVVLPFIETVLEVVQAKISGYTKS